MVVLVGCHSKPASSFDLNGMASKVKVGMAESDVESLLGKPTNGEGPVVTNRRTHKQGHVDVYSGSGEGVPLKPPMLILFFDEGNRLTKIDKMVSP